MTTKGNDLSQFVEGGGPEIPGYPPDLLYTQVAGTGTPAYTAASVDNLPFHRKRDPISL